MAKPLFFVKSFEAGTLGPLFFAPFLIGSEIVEAGPHAVRNFSVYGFQEIFGVIHDNFKEKLARIVVDRKLLFHHLKQILSGGPHRFCKRQLCLYRSKKCVSKKAEKK